MPAGCFLRRPAQPLCFPAENGISTHVREKSRYTGILVVKFSCTRIPRSHHRPSFSAIENSLIAAFPAHREKSGGKHSAALHLCILSGIRALNELCLHISDSFPLQYWNEREISSLERGDNVVREPEEIVIGSDHAGFEMKEFLKEELHKRGFALKDVGTETTKPTDYPLYAGRVAHSVADGENDRGIAVCGAGIGASIAANRVRGVRAALCTSVEMAKLSRAHNNANVLVLGGRTTPKELATQILDAWLETPFEGGRHIPRIEMLDEDKPDL